MEYIVISHTHWDREWYMPLELMQLRLVDLIDNCLAVLEREPAYIFHLDAQTVVLEDYLLYRPHKREELKKRIGEKRLMVGPWYLQNDFYLTSGEATVRNLQIGIALAQEFGHCDRVGYAPDQFGNISQLPQILQNFGLTTFVFGRGIPLTRLDEEGREVVNRHPGEFIWQGPDGSRLTAIYLGMWYNNAQRFSAQIQRAARMVENLDEYFRDTAATPYRLLMNGVDHLEAQEDLLPILRALEEHWHGERHIRQGRLSEFADTIERVVRESGLELPLIEGELRQGADLNLLKGCLSSRSYLKTANVEAQNELEVQLEPLYAMLELGGLTGAYSRDHFRYLWKKLLRNHPHDSICGCSRDEVHRRMEESYRSLALTAGEWWARGAAAAADHVELDVRDPKDSIVAVINPTEAARTGMVEAVLDFPVEEAAWSFVIEDPRGRPVPFRLLLHERVEKDIFTPINLPGHMTVDRYHIRFYEQGIKPFAVKGYKIRTGGGSLPAAPAVWKLVDQTADMENEYLRLTVHADGAVDLFDKRSNRRYDDLLDWEEVGETGESYVHIPAAGPPRYGRDYPARVTVDEESGTCVIYRTLTVPRGYDFDRDEREEEMAECPTEIRLWVEPGNPVVRLTYRLDNRAADHRLRLLVRSGIQTDESVADMPFDVVRRHKDAHFFNTRSRVFPNTSFAALEDGEAGLAVFTQGQHEYEHLAESGALAFTVVRGTDVISRDPATRKVAGGDQWSCPENQCLRTLTGSMGLYAYAGGYEAARVPLLAKLARNPLRCRFAPVNTKKFTGGRPAVQDTQVQEFFYRPDPWPGASLPNNRSLLTVDGDGVLVSAFKQTDKGGGYILRLVNLSDAPRVVRVAFAVQGAVYLSDMTESIGERIGGETAELTLPAKRIQTLLYRPD